MVSVFRLYVLFNTQHTSVASFEISPRGQAPRALPMHLKQNHLDDIRRRSLLGGYKAHSEALQESLHLKTMRQGTGKPTTKPSSKISPGDCRNEGDVLGGLATNATDGGGQKSASKWRRSSTVARGSERMPGAEQAGVKTSSVSGLGGGGGLAKCQRIWKMVPEAMDDRPTWLRQYEVCKFSASKAVLFFFRRACNSQLSHFIALSKCGHSTATVNGVRYARRVKNPYFWQVLVINCFIWPEYAEKKRHLPSPTHSAPLSPTAPPVLQDGSIEYGAHYQNYAGRNKVLVHFRVPLSWARLELIVSDLPNTRRFADFRPKQR